MPGLIPPRARHGMGMREPEMPGEPELREDDIRKLEELTKILLNSLPAEQQMAFISKILGTTSK